MTENWVTTKKCIEHLCVSRTTFYGPYQQYFNEGIDFRYKNPLKRHQKVWKLSAVDKTISSSSRVLIRRARKLK